MKKSLLIYLISAVFLFGLVSCNKTCSHSYDEWVVIKEATCTEEGSRERVCSNCNDKESEVIQATGHSYGEWVTTPATCTEDGLKERVCSECGDKESEVLQVTGHTFSEEWAYDGTNHWHESTCGHDLKKDEGNHNPVNGVCSICGIETFTSGLQYTLNWLKTEYSLTGIGTATDTDIVIPSSYNGLPVTAIGENAFMNCSDITSITMPNSVTSIESGAFYGCSITSISMSNSIISITSDAFSECSSLQYNEYDNALYLGNSDNPYIALIKEKNTSISSCTINPQTKMISTMAFFNCSELTSVSIPDSVDYIGEGAFELCEKLTLNMYDNALYLGNNDNPYLVLVVAQNLYIRSCEINSQTKIILGHAFGYCNNITSITIPNSVTYIVRGAFTDCRALENIVVESGNTTYHSDSNCLIDTKTKTLIVGCKNSIIPTDGSVISIGNSAFQGCDGLTSCIIPDCILSIDDYAFADCTNLKNVTIGSNVIFIGFSAFRGCRSLTSITIPKSVTYIGVYAFSDCSALESIVVESGNTTYHSDSNCLIETKTNTLILGCKNSIIPTDGSVISIYSSAFTNCNGLTSIIIPDCVKHIYSSIFYGCRNLESVTFESSEIVINYSMFSYCSSLTSIIYNGTIEEWQKIYKPSGWDNGTGDYTVTCTDGTVSKDGTATPNA